MSASPQDCHGLRAAVDYRDLRNVWAQVLDASGTVVREEGLGRQWDFATAHRNAARAARRLLALEILSRRQLTLPGLG